MKKILIVFLTCTQPVWSSIASVQHKSCTSFTASVACAYASNITANSLLISQTSEDQGTGAITCSDNLNGSWSKASASDIASGSALSRKGNIFYFLKSVAGAVTVTCTITTGNAVEVNIH